MNFSFLNNTTIIKDNGANDKIGDTINLSINHTCAITCSLKKAQINNAFNNYSLRIVVGGTAEYKLNKRTYQISENQYMLTNAFQEGYGIIDSKEDVVQFCIHFTPEIISDVFTSLNFRNNNIDFDCNSPKEKYIRLFENIFSLNSITPLSKYLHPFAHRVKNGQQMQLCEEALLEMAEVIVLNEMKIQEGLIGLKKIKLSTRHEIMRRLLRGKEYMDANFMKDPKISEVAQIAMMAEHFFFRNFKQAFNISPYQYILSRKIEYARELILKNEQNIGQIALFTGFSDIHTFSKAFKRQVGISPSMIK